MSTYPHLLAHLFFLSTQISTHRTASSKDFKIIIHFSVSLIFHIPTIKKLYPQNISSILPLLTYSSATTDSSCNHFSPGASDGLPISVRRPLHSIFTEHPEWSWSPTAQNTSEVMQGMTIKVLHDLTTSYIHLFSLFDGLSCYQAWSCPGSLHLQLCQENSSPRYLVGLLPHFIWVFAQILIQTRGHL